MNIDDDVLETAKALAAMQKKSLGEVVSRLMRKAVEPAKAPPAVRNGIPLFPVSANARTVTPEIIAELLEETP